MVAALAPKSIRLRVSHVAASTSIVLSLEGLGVETVSFCLNNNDIDNDYNDDDNGACIETTKARNVGKLSENHSLARFDVAVIHL